MVRRIVPVLLSTFGVGALLGVFATDFAEAGPVPMIPKDPPKNLYQPPACFGAVHHVQPASDGRSCGAEMFIPCFPYGCDAAGNFCASTCTRDRDCAAGARCDAGSRQCVVALPPASPPPLCPSQCVGGGPSDAVKYSVKQRAFNPATNQCQDVAIAPCSPFACDVKSGMCQFGCASNLDCAPGAMCNPQTKVCALAIGVCKNMSTLTLASGQELPCAPYACEASLCKTRCAGDNDCTAGFACQQDRCVAKK